MNNNFSGYFPTWCPGCGNFGIWGALKNACQNQKIPPDNLAVVYGVGCSGNMNDFFTANNFHSLHGRSVPTAVGIKIANHGLSVVVIAGDGDCYGEGGNHLIHAARGNHDITVIVHDNRVYGLTTGQVAPTALKGSKSKSTPEGIIEVPLNPIALALTQGATYIAQGFAGEVSHLTGLIETAIRHKGFSLVNIFQPCVTFNPLTTYDWYRQRVYKLDGKNHDPKNFQKAMEKALETEEKLPIGIVYQVEKPTYTDYLPQLQKGVLAEADLHVDLGKYMDEFV